MPHGSASFALGSIAVLGLGTANGGYFPSSWGWAIVAFAIVVIWIAASRGVTQPTRLEVIVLTGIAFLTAWAALSSMWGSASVAINEAFRVLLYAIGILAALLITRRGSVVALLAGTLAGSSALALYALGTRLLPERLGTFDPVAGYRLAAPLGYWNALGLLCAIALILSIGLASATRSPLRAAAAAAAAPLLLTTLYFTFSRGSWIALGIGAVVAIAVDPRRIGLVATALAAGVPSAVAVLVSSQAEALTHQRVVLGSASQEGHRTATVIVGLVAASALLTAGSTLLRRRIDVSPRVSRVLLGGLVTVIAVAAIGSVVAAGGPDRLVHRAWDAFSGPLPNTRHDLGKRLFSFSGNGRADLYSTAWHEAGERPANGTGAGSFEAHWLSSRPNSLKVRNAHSLYFETLAELGVIGLFALLAVLGAPLVALARARRQPGLAAAGGAFTAYLAGAAVDWEWQVTSVTLAALLIGAALLAAARPSSSSNVPSQLRYGVVGAAVAVGVVGFTFLVGNMLLARGAQAAAAANWASAERDARTATGWLPWSTQPWRQLGEAQLAQSETARARNSFRKAIAKDAGDWSLWFDLARASSGQSQKVALARATRLNPLSPEIKELKLELLNAGTINGS